MRWYYFLVLLLLPSVLSLTPTDIYKSMISTPVDKAVIRTIEGSYYNRTEEGTIKYGGFLFNFSGYNVYMFIGWERPGCKLFEDCIWGFKAILPPLPPNVTIELLKLYNVNPVVSLKPFTLAWVPFVYLAYQNCTKITADGTCYFNAYFKQYFIRLLYRYVRDEKIRKIIIHDFFERPGIIFAPSSIPDLYPTTPDFKMVDPFPNVYFITPLYPPFGNSSFAPAWFPKYIPELLTLVWQGYDIYHDKYVDKYVLDLIKVGWWRTVYKMYNGEKVKTGWYFEKGKYHRLYFDVVPAILDYEYVNESELWYWYLRLVKAYAKLFAAYQWAPEKEVFLEFWEKLYGIPIWEKFYDAISPYKYKLLKRWIELGFEGLEELKEIAQEMPKYKWYQILGIYWDSYRWVWDKVIKNLKEGKKYWEQPLYFVVHCVKTPKYDSCERFKEMYKGVLQKFPVLVKRFEVTDYLGAKHIVEIYKSDKPAAYTRNKEHPVYVTNEEIALSLLPLRRAFAFLFPNDTIANNYVCTALAHSINVVTYRIRDGVVLPESYYNYSITVFHTGHIPLITRPTDKLLYYLMENFVRPELRKIFGRDDFEVPVTYFSLDAFGIEFPANLHDYAALYSQAAPTDYMDLLVVEFGWVPSHPTTYDDWDWYIITHSDLGPLYALHFGTLYLNVKFNIPERHYICWPKPRGTEKERYINEIVQEILTGEYKNETEFLIHVSDYLNYLILDNPELLDWDTYYKIELARVYAYYVGNITKAKELLREVVLKILEKIEK